jgi:hypothetical protein
MIILAHALALGGSLHDFTFIFGRIDGLLALGRHLGRESLDLWRRMLGLPRSLLTLLVDLPPLFLFWELIKLVIFRFSLGGYFLPFRLSQFV